MAETVFRSASIDHRERTYEIAYFLRPGGAKSIVYLHGLGSTKEDFLAATGLPEFAEYTLLAFDFPGCGESTTYYNEVALGIDDLVAITLELVTRLGLDRPTVIGQSLGGLTALQYASRYRERVSGFVNVEGNLAAEDCDIQSRDVFRQRFLGDEERFFQRLRARLTGDRKPGFAEFAESLRHNVADRAYFDYCRSIVDYSDGYALLDEFIELPFPKLFVHGECNAHLSYLPRLAAAGVPVISVPRSDHFPAASNPTFYFDTIARFVEGQSQAC